MKIHLRATIEKVRADTPTLPDEAVYLPEDEPIEPEQEDEE